MREIKPLIENSNIPLNNKGKQDALAWRQRVIPAKIVVETQIVFLKLWLRQGNAGQSLQFADGTRVDPKDPRSLLEGCRRIILNLQEGDGPLEPEEVTMLKYLNDYLGPIPRRNAA